MSAPLGMCAEIFVKGGENLLVLLLFNTTIYLLCRGPSTIDLHETRLQPMCTMKLTFFFFFPPVRKGSEQSRKAKCYRYPTIF